MTDQEVLELLRIIDEGYKLTEAEKQELAGIEKITWEKIEKIPDCIDLLTGLRELDVSGGAISNSNLIDIPESIGNLPRLQSLYLINTQIRELPESIGNLTSLQILDLWNTQIRALPESIGNLTYLQSLSLNFAQIRALPESIGNLRSLQVLNLWHTQIRALPESIGNLTSLQDLNLSDTQVSTLPKSIENLTSLCILDLRHTQISTLPESVGNLPNLKYLSLENLTLAELPESLLRLNLEYKNTEYKPWKNEPGIFIQDLSLQNQPIEIFSQSRELIIEYYKSVKSKSTSPINECKVVFLGDGGAGKSLIIDRLMNDGIISDDFDGESTPGICISSNKYPIGNEEIELHFWDFGGQAIMHSMHRLFLTNRTLYVVVTNARDNKANEQAWYWIRNIKSFANGAPVLLLVNQKDQNPSANVNENGLRKEYPELKQVRIVSALKDTKEEFDKDVRDVICHIVSDMKTVHTPFSRSWLSLMNDIQDMSEDYITSEVFYTKCSRYGIDIDRERLDDLIKWYQDLGVCFYSKAHPISAQYMVLKPRWLLNALYVLIFNGRKYAKNGLIPETAIYTLICEKVPDDVIKKVWNDITYKPEEIQYIINVLLNFELIYRLDNDHFFIPMLCDENEPEIVDSFDSDKAFHVCFKYEYLPENVLHRLMVRHGYELNTNIVWRTGALFERRHCGWSSLVCINGNSLDVYAKSENQEIHPVNSYLDMIRESVHRINDEFGFSADEYIAYREGNKEDFFEYETLIGSKKAGQNTIYSRAFKKLINIDSILGIIKKPNDRLTQEVIEHMISSLASMSQRCVDLRKRNEVELTGDFQNSMESVLNAKYDLQISREYTMGRAKKKIGEADLYFFINKEGIKQDLYILENKVIDNFSAQYMQLMGYLNPNFSAGITLSINKEKGWEEAYDYIIDKLTVMKNTEEKFAPISIERKRGANGTKYVKTEHVVPETGLTMAVYHLVLQLSDEDRLRAARKARK